MIDKDANFYDNDDDDDEHNDYDDDDDYVNNNDMKASIMTHSSRGGIETVIEIKSD